jgi:hypothetical protein
MKTEEELIGAELPDKGFFGLKELGILGPYSSDYWSKRVKAGEVRAIQRNANRHGSRILIPRGEVIRHLAGCVR